MDRDMNSAIQGSANEFLSPADKYMYDNSKKWEEELEFIDQAMKYEYNLKGKYARMHRAVQRKYELLDFKSQQKLTDKELKRVTKQKSKVEDQLKKFKKKKDEQDLKQEKARRKKLEDDIHRAKLDMLEEEADVFGKSLKNSVQREWVKIKLQGGFGKALLGSLGAASKQAVGNAQKALNSSVDDAMQLFVGKASKINARLQGTNKTFTSMNDVFERNLGASPYVKYTDAIDNLAELVDTGVAYNVEQRAFLQTMTDKVATTFNAFDANLLKIIRIQQEDSTVYRMGAEAKLTQLFNDQFQDTTYLSDVYDSVSGAIVNSVAQLGTAGGAEYEYNIQKWLGSMYSLGMSSNTVTNLASAIDMLATGDVQGLAGSGLQNLLVMAANKGGLSYGDLLASGVNADNVDVLMSNVIAYWSELANSNNQVVRKQMSELFGLDMADMVAVKNFSQSDLNALKGGFSYNQADAVLQDQFNQVYSRMHSSELIENAYKNVLAGIGTDLASSPGAAATWYINSLIKDATGGINIPFITAMGTGVGLETDLNSIIQLGMVGVGTIGQIGNVISSMNNNGGLNLSNWDADQYTTHGQGTAGIVSGVRATTSQQTFIGNSESSDIYQSSLHAAYDNVDTSVAGQAVDDAEKMQDAIMESIDPNVSAILDLLKQVTSGNALRVKVEDYGLISSF